MTVAVVVKVFDGLVIAADSATSLPLQNGGTQVYNNANKIFHLHRQLPVAAMTWGLGNIKDASIATLTKDLRRRLMGNDPDFKSWKLDPDTYTIKGVADRYVEMFQDLYAPAFAGAPIHPSLGMLIVGYSAGKKQGEAWQVLIDDPANPPAPALLIDVPNYGWQAFAQPEATERLFYGIDQQLAMQIKSVLQPGDWSAVEGLIGASARQPVAPGMPFADAIQLAEFLVSTTAQYSHFLLGPDTVGGVVDVAGINRHEGFRWIARKHYYPPELNPWGPAHDR